MIDVHTAAEFLDFGARIGAGPRAQEQLEGAVAVHHLLETQRVAYLADEVGMGKTYVALGALALFRHFQPDFRVLVIAPRENIQVKWLKELRNFVTHNVRFADMRVKGLDGRPARPLVACGNLLELVHEVSIDRNRDFFLRLTSFSLPVVGKDSVDPEAARRLRDGIRRTLPWMRDEVFDLRNKQLFKDQVGRAICCALPPFDLVIVDEGHNLKHGFGENVSARNRVLGLAMGHPRSEANVKLFPGFQPRARRVLFLSATPVEETYRQLWNQLDVFGLGAPYRALIASDIEEEEKKSVAAQFLIRRVTSVRVGAVEYTKNLYRREWRSGGVKDYDEPITIADTRQRLVVALVQKKVSELLGHARFNSSFQIGMLASFESFLETARLKREPLETGNFDDADQTDDSLEREGIDVCDVNRLARTYKKRFTAEMPHPKMDALVDSLSAAWRRGEKTLVFVRRVASVKELKAKLDERYDAWLLETLIKGVPETVHRRFRELFQRYQSEKLEGQAKLSHGTNGAHRADDADRGGNDTFFAWFFRGEGPPKVISGANVQQRFIQRGTEYSTFFADNYIADVLGCRPGEVEVNLASAVEMSSQDLRTILRDRSKHFLTRAKRPARADRFEAVQGAAIELLKDRTGPYQERSRVVWHERFELSKPTPHATDAPDIENWLEHPTFFTELREHRELRSKIWPPPSHPDQLHAFREQELRSQMLASAARLGHGIIDLYLMTIRRLGSIELRAQETADNENADRQRGRILEYLQVLERQMALPLSERGWGIYDELADIAAHFDLILDVNEPEARQKPLSETARTFGQLLRSQQPVGGMSGQVNQTLVRQFRMPGYPLVLVTTDLLQEGEDLHTFCSSVHHYGISWTPSSMEQRIGRIDRVRSQTDRRLSAITGTELPGEAKMQVYFPHLQDTVEVLQVQRVLERMNVFLRLMHEGLTTHGRDDRTIDSNREFIRARRLVPQIQEKLRSAFPVRPECLVGNIGLATGPEFAEAIAQRFAAIAKAELPGLAITWEHSTNPGTLLGTAILGDRVQPFTLLLKSVGMHVMVRCISPVGCVGPSTDADSIVAHAAKSGVKIGAILTQEERTYDLTVEGDVLLAEQTDSDATRVSMLIWRIVHQADALERELLSGHDEVLETFRTELLQENTDGR